MSNMKRIAYGSMVQMEHHTTVGDNFGGTESVGGSEAAITTFNNYPVVNLHVSAKELADLDVLTKSDPICVLFIYQNNKWVEFARTEVVWNNLNPEWVTFFTVMFVFEIRQPLMFRVYDVDSQDASLKSHDFIGEASIDLSEIISGTGIAKLELKVNNSNKKRGTLFIQPEQVENCASMVQGRITSGNIKKTGLFANDPFFVISKSSESGKFIPIFQSEVTKKMNWKMFTIPLQLLCNLDYDRPIRITFYNYKKRSAAEEIAYHDTTFARLSEATGSKLKIVDKKNKDFGDFKLESLNIIQKFSYVDYLRGGIQLNLISAIDFTASNRDPRDPRSLHFVSPDGINQYESCIRAVGEILCAYDSDQLFPVLGFGAKIQGTVQHCFPLTFNPQAPCVQGLQGILGAYHNALVQVQLSGPTLFSHIIRYSTQMANQSFQESRTYTILLIITDGIINDMPDTIDAVVEAGRAPLSIIIVGVGDADFSAMDVLDADDTPLVHRNGQKMVRDIVQFVPFNKFKNKHYSLLAAEVLEEIPRQLIEWAEMNGVRPNGM